MRFINQRDFCVILFSFILASCSGQKTDTIQRPPPIVKIISPSIQVPAVGVLQLTENDAYLKGLKRGLRSRVPLTLYFEKANSPEEVLEKAKKLFKRVRVIVAVGDNNIETYQSIQEKNHFPTLYISKKFTPSKNRLDFRPNIHELAKTLMEELSERKIASLAILIPTDQEASPLIQEILRLLETNKIKIITKASYNPENMGDLEAACRHLFQLDAPERQEELRVLYQREKERLGEKFQARFVALPPKTPFDAVLIPDQARNVAYAAKMFRYFHVDNIPFIGGYQWRSQAITQGIPRGSFFVDFIGKYSDLPFIDSPDPFFLGPEDLLSTDQQLMGLYAGHLARLAATFLKEEELGHFAKRLELKDSYLGKRKALESGQQFNWPTFVFDVEEQSIRLTRRGD